MAAPTHEAHKQNVKRDDSQDQPHKRYEASHYSLEPGLVFRLVGRFEELWSYMRNEIDLVSGSSGTGFGSFRNSEGNKSGVTPDL